METTTAASNRRRVIPQIKNERLLPQEGMLVCPGCGSTYLHQEVIEVFNPDQEDAAEGLHVTVNAASMAADRSMDNNPSERRQGLSIHFNCETCANQLTLQIAQHKGETRIRWDVQALGQNLINRRWDTGLDISQIDD